MRHELQTWLDTQGTVLRHAPLYRLVWSEAEYEWRRGVFNEFDGATLIRSITGTKLVRKYNYIHDRWIFEKWLPPEVAFDEDLPKSREGSYEPLYVFQDNRGNALPVIRAALEFIIYCDSRRQRPTQSAPEDKAAEAASETKKYNELYDSIDTTVISSQLHMKEGIVKP